MLSTIIPFWASLYLSAFGQIGDEPDEGVICASLGVKERQTLDWFHKFTGWYPEILNDSDGYADDPTTIPIELANGVELRVDCHPGDTIWYLRGADGKKATLASAGPHWELPGLRWQKATALVAAASGPNWKTMLLLLPIIWITAGDDAAKARRVAKSAWTASRLLTDAASAATMADVWLNATAHGSKYRWQQTRSGNWTCDSEYSTRHSRRSAKKRSLLSKLLKAAGVAK